MRRLADTTIARFFAPRGAATPGWEGFRAAYPAGSGILTLSRVGLGRDREAREWAVVYAGLQGDWLAGVGRLFILRKERDAWRVVRSFLLWIS